MSDSGQRGDKGRVDKAGMLASMTWSAEWMEGHEVDGKPGYKDKRYKLYKKEELWLALATTEHFNKTENPKSR